MCGIAGVVCPTLTDGDRDAVDNMVHAMFHRGPDAHDTTAVDGGIFGHSRLAIIDLDQAANQPMQDTSGRYLIVYNGELYNFRELRRELTSYRFRTNSDTEVVLAAFATWGERCLDRLKMRKLLDGIRGNPGVDITAYCKAAAKLSVLAIEFKQQIKEVDINPIKVLERGCMGLDALIVMNSENTEICNNR